jgi:DNA-binding HxlR family transcriptional regulator
MYEKKIPKNFDCGMSVLMEIIGGKWKSYLVFLIHEGKKRPVDLQKAIPEANRRVLDLQLRELEFHGIIGRNIFPEIPLRTEYYITDFGKSLLPLLNEMDRWGKNKLDDFKQLMKQKAEKLNQSA